MRLRTPLLLLFVSALGATEAAAHYTFILPQAFRVTAGETMTIGFHSGHDFPESAAVLKRLTEPTVRTERGAIRLGGLKEDGQRIVASTIAPTSSHIIVTAVNPTAIEQMKPDSFEKYLEEEGLGHVIRARAARGEASAPGRERYAMHAKAILTTGAPGDGYRSVVGLPLEIVPEKDPYRLQSGEMLPVRVLFRGKPAADLQLTAASTAEGVKTGVVGKTDADGRLAIPVSRGQWRLHTILMERVTEAEIEWESTWTTLTFEVS